MISKKNLRDLAKKWQTNDINVTREYLEHLFLSNFYRHKKAGSIVFKGGTALRLVHGSPRFSEDLDFDAFVLGCWEIEYLWEEVLVTLEKEGLQVDIKDSIKTFGGCLGIFTAQVYDIKIDIKIEVSLRSRWQKKEKRLHVNTNLFIPDYSIVVVSELELVTGKLNAIINRKKPRDLFDLYYILRKRLEIDFVARHKEKLLKIAENYDYSSFKEIVRPLLPRSFHSLAADFKNSLMSELERL